MPLCCHCLYFILIIYFPLSPTPTVSTRPLFPRNLWVYFSSFPIAQSSSLCLGLVLAYNCRASSKGSVLFKERLSCFQRLQTEITSHATGPAQWGAFEPPTELEPTSSPTPMPINQRKGQNKGECRDPSQLRGCCPGRSVLTSFSINGQAPRSPNQN